MAKNKNQFKKCMSINAHIDFYCTEKQYDRCFVYIFCLQCFQCLSCGLSYYSQFKLQPVNLSNKYINKHWSLQERTSATHDILLLSIWRVYILSLKMAMESILELLCEHGIPCRFHHLFSKKKLLLVNSGI